MYNLQDHFIWEIFDFFCFFGRNFASEKEEAKGNPKPPRTTMGLKIEMVYNIKVEW
jgi:hypothetical protein